ncbi:hypothetical protein CLOM_g8982 [Closterium sp. NIES-68]|nr:hypothetical protein CLOM_g8982 [Closterium sp. NIES-68]GJP58780.1 hypothetical protein CLOP_g3521 [Closterium sp. NIES-67]
MGIPYQPFQATSVSVSSRASRACASAFVSRGVAPQALTSPTGHHRDGQAPRSLPVAASNLATHVSVRLLSDGGDEQLFKMRRSARLAFLLDLYCQQHRSARRASVQLWFHGRPVGELATPDDLRMVDSDSVRVVECN